MVSSENRTLPILAVRNPHEEIQLTEVLGIDEVRVVTVHD